MKKQCLFFTITFLCIFSLPSLASEPDLITRNTAAFALFDGQKGDLKMDNWRAAHVPLPPFSTFKIINSLIAIDSKLVDPEKTKLTFDPKQYPIQDWWPKSWYSKPLSLRDAFQSSAVPVFRQLATQIGPETMQRYLNQFVYGNRDISSGIDNFWLNGSLRIAAIDQIEVLRRIFEGRSPASADSVNKLKAVMKTEPWQGYDVYAKTGMGSLDDGTALGWYVGILENPKDNQNRFYFAGFVTGKKLDDVKEKRITYAHDQLNALMNKTKAEAETPAK